MSDGKLAMITLSPFGSTEAQVITGGAKEDPHVVKSPIEPGDFFVAIVRGEGVRVTATAVPSMTPVYFDLLVS
ncbi:hypothetical protein [Mycolicibacterium litorale]|uniref:hypothetical protein n=1 Tax=Mycolicibacterium litorale TaxID=758802 RepID=UPI0010669293|nr:hypothetical protein [Mycolicibacterium litorale]MCV7418821.1 hypothetical protein [Mycolicibacterium litorale]